MMPQAWKLPISALPWGVAAMSQWRLQTWYFPSFDKSLISGAFGFLLQYRRLHRIWPTRLWQPQKSHHLSPARGYLLRTLANSLPCILRSPTTSVFDWDDHYFYVDRLYCQLVTHQGEARSGSTPSPTPPSGARQINEHQTHDTGVFHHRNPDVGLRMLHGVPSFRPSRDSVLEFMVELRKHCR